VEIATPHDALFKAVFSQPEHAAGELRQLLPAPLADRIDWPSLTLVPGAYVDEDLRLTQSDLLFTAPCDGASLLLYVLFEHQSTHDPRMAFRLLRYMVRIWESLLAVDAARPRLPVILPIVLHHSERGWTSSTSFEALLDADRPTLALVGPHVPRFAFLLDDISAERDDALRARAWTSALGRLVLLCMRHAREPDVLFTELARWVELFRQVRRAPGGAAALAQLWTYIMAALRKEGESPKAVVKRLIAVVDEESKEEIMTLAEAFKQEGLEQGLELGLARGALLTLRGTLLKQLRKRFGEVPDPVRARIEAAGSAQLDAWLDRVVTAGSLDEVMADA
jgi:hypothetical protein